jgi:hypothetical protein
LKPVQTEHRIPQFPERLALRMSIYALWLGFFAVAALLTVFLSAWQGFSPDGPPPGFTPEPLWQFFLKNFPLMSFGLAVQIWWFSVPLLALTIWEARHYRKPRRKRVTDYDL